MQPRKATDFSNLPASKKLRADLADLFLGSAVNIVRAGGMFQTTKAIGAASVDYICAIGQKQEEQQHKGQTQRSDEKTLAEHALAKALPL